MMGKLFPDSSALIVGLARNCERKIGKSIEKMFELSRHWGEAQVLIITNDNKDKTLAAIDASGFKARGGRLMVLDGLGQRIKHRTERLAFARNEALHMMWALPQLPDHFVMLDMDGVNHRLDAGTGLEKALSTAPADWCGLFANQQPYYYDIFALRHPIWCNIDCIAEVSRQPIYVPRPVARWKITGARQISISPWAAPFAVESAFGGLGIYKSSALRDCWYAGQQGNVDVCEHVPFNLAIQAKGQGRHYILPALINDAPREHIFRQFRKSRFQDMFDAGALTRLDDGQSVS